MAQDNPSENGLTIRPTPEIVAGMKPEIRAALYGVLARFPENPDQASAFRFEGSSPDEWFAGSSLSPSTRQLVDPLIYRRGNLMYFADNRVVEQKLASPDELWLLLKALSRCRTLLVDVEISQESDVESLVNYWGRGGRTKDVRPILESLSSAPSPETISISRLLPALPQHLLYTYPDAEDRDSPLRRNCHWTSFNFFNAEPDDRFADLDAVNLALVGRLSPHFGAAAVGRHRSDLQRPGAVGPFGRVRRRRHRLHQERPRYRDPVDADEDQRHAAILSRRRVPVLSPQRSLMRRRSRSVDRIEKLWSFGSDPRPQKAASAARAVPQI